MPRVFLGGVTDMLTLFDCLDVFTVQSNNWDVSSSFTDLSRYNAAQPTAQQRTDFTATVTAMLNIDGNCSSVTVPTSISSIYAIRTFRDTSKNTDFCVFYEKTSRQSFISTRREYEKGWGIFVVPKTVRQVSRFIHLSAPHPKWDSGTPQQAAYLFANSGAKSLLVDGRHRWAISTQSTCISAGNHSLTDPTHDNKEVFHSASQVIHNWLRTLALSQVDVRLSKFMERLQILVVDLVGLSTRVSLSRKFPRKSIPAVAVHNHLLHANTTIYTIHLSSNTKIKATASLEVPLSTRPIPLPRPTALPITSLEFGAGSGGVNMPINDTVCDLAAFTNVFGRIVNGVSNEPANNECVTAATDTSALNRNRFVHAEQSPAMRTLSPDSCPSTGCAGAFRSINTNWPAWNTALKKAFAATCVGGVPTDSGSLLCPP
ncbi:hypothetical protein BC936DRAFT_143246 [Jimgerdemannia flammicorona]|uniref:Uncharacterized protein n=1 Tax=Jimgerdemannia flammicorona TaxID=994334 RepID=A0A432ZZ91_9FUNG|nr:hypothetical protein BC936DRAFT_143246 [Jimgerdemannia flammicorona]